MRGIKKSIILVNLLLLLPNVVFAGFFTRNQTLQDGDEQKNESGIVVLDNLDKIIVKRRQEAQKLITEGNKLIKKGEKKKNQSLITKGRIKKEIGEKQLQLLKEQVEEKKKQEEKDVW